MGRQIAVALSEDDERVFLTFLRTLADVRILRRSAPSPELIFVPELPPRGPDQYVFQLWNTAFPWSPEFGQWGPEMQDPQRASHFYIKNIAGAPLLEYSREAFEDPDAVVRGRVYWNTDFPIYHGPEYDRTAFNVWFNQVVRWLRKNGKRVQLAKNWNQYWLPGASALRAASATRDR